MRAKCIVAALLILTTALSASACVEGVGGSAAKRCVSHVECSRVLASGTCRAIVKSSPARCGIRGLVQFHSLALQKPQAEMPLRPMRGRVVIPSRVALRLSSIGSPETDRGPPLS